MSDDSVWGVLCVIGVIAGAIYYFNAEEKPKELPEVVHNYEMKSLNGFNVLYDKKTGDVWRFVCVEPKNDRNISCEGAYVLEVIPKQDETMSPSYEAIVNYFNQPLPNK